MPKKQTALWKQKSPLWRHQPGVDALKHYRRLVKLGLLDSEEECQKKAKEADLRKAASEVYLSKEYLTERNKTQLCYTLVNANKNGNDPVVYADSLTALLNDAVAKYALRIKDIKAMRKGDRLHVLLLDRNIGDSLQGTKPGTLLNLKEEIDGGKFYVAWYTHDHGLTGTLDMYREGVVHECFTWELNQQRTKGIFWCPIDEPDKSRDKSDADFVDYRKLDPNTKVGWRGPAIAMDDVEKLPKKFRHYDTWWNDYAP